MIWKRLKTLTPEEEQAYQERMQQAKLDWRDRVAMLLAAGYTLLLPCIAVLLALALLLLWMVGAL